MCIVICLACTLSPVSVEHIERRVSDPDALRPVLAAAREAFARYGVHRTRMEDVATEADMPRQYLYRFVSGKDELVELALLERLREMSDELLLSAERMNGELADDLVSGIVGSLMLGRRDAEFTNLAAALPSPRLSDILMGAQSPAQELTKRWLRPILERARAEKRLRTDVDEDAIVEWIRGILTFLAPREDLDEATMRVMLTRFMLPSLLKK